jgi:hypothetical protein
MTDKSAFTDAEWTALTEAPMHVTLAMMAAGEHGPISMVKESSAAVRVISRPGDRGSANELIAAIAPEAESKEVRKGVSHDAKANRGGDISALVALELSDLDGARAALEKIPADEGAHVGAWLVDIAREMANASKGVNEHEKAAIDKLAAMFGVAQG